MEFTIYTEVDRRALTAIARALRKTLRRRRYLLLHIAGWLIVGLDALFSLLLLAAGEGLSSLLPNLLTGLAVLVILLKEDAINGAVGLRTALPDMRRVTARFTPEGYCHTTPVSESKWHYDRILALCETEDFFIFLLSKRHGQIYAKSGFTYGTAEAFRAFITGVTGLPMQAV